jgi:CheY-like chemotaxis protein
MVLIVDDEEPIAQALAFIIEDAGYATRIAPHGRAALTAIREQPPDLVLTDLMMPQMTGAELIATLRADGHHDLPIVLLSAAGLDAMRDMGANAILPKPFELHDIEAMLTRFLS